MSNHNAAWYYPAPTWWARCIKNYVAFWNGGEVVSITHQELGDMIGALRESVTKVLDEFQREGLVELGRGRVILRDVAVLQLRLDE